MKLYLAIIFILISVSTKGQDVYFGMPSKHKRIQQGDLIILNYFPNMIDRSSLITESDKNYVNMIIDYTKEKEYNFILSIHVDEQYSYVYSLRLTKKIAQSVTQHIKNMGINNITVKGMGNSKPLVLNPKSIYRHRINRRLELLID